MDVLLEIFRGRSEIGLTWKWSEKCFPPGARQWWIESERNVERTYETSWRVEVPHCSTCVSSPRAWYVVDDRRSTPSRNNILGK